MDKTLIAQFEISLCFDFGCNLCHLWRQNCVYSGNPGMAKYLNNFISLFEKVLTLLLKKKSRVTILWSSRLWAYLKIGMVCSSVDVVTVVSTDPCWPPSEKCSRFTSTVSFLTGPPEKVSNKQQLWSTFFWSWWLIGEILVILCQIEKWFFMQNYFMTLTLGYIGANRNYRVWHQLVNHR